MDMLDAIWRSARLYVTELEDRTKNLEINRVVFYISIGVVLVAIFSLIPVV